METILTISSLLILFVLSFLGPSPIPVPTDLVAVSFVIAGLNPIVIFIVLLVGHMFGLLAFYLLGFKSGKIIEHWEKQRHKTAYKFAEKLYHKYGKYTLLLCSVPFIGKPLVLTAGIFKLKATDMFLWYIFGKICFYSSVLFFRFKFL